MQLCDIRDGARAHIVAAERPEASGRYLVGLKGTVDHRTVTNILQKRFPEYEIYTGREGPCLDLLDISKIENELGMSMIPLEETVVDMAQSLIQLGLAVPKLRKGY